MPIRTGQCLCNRVRYNVRGEALRIGICHCADCRKESGSVFTVFAVWPRKAFSFTGEVSVFKGRSFCPICGSRLFNLTEEEAEIRVGSLDEAPTGLTPTYEIWIKRQEHWLPPLHGGHHFEENRPQRDECDK